MLFIRGIKIKNFRNFNDFDMRFNDGLNVIIGPNNSGKTGLLHAIKLLSSPSEIGINDFNKNNLTNFKELYIDEAPYIQFEYYIEHKIIESDTTDESILKLLPFLGMEKIKESRSKSSEGIVYNIFATIQATFLLDNKFIENYKKEVSVIDSFDDYIIMLNRYVDKHYLWRYTNGNTETSIDSKLAKKIFDIRFIEAERSSDGVRKEIKREINDLFSSKDKIKELDEFKLDASNELSNILEPSINKMKNLFENENNEIGLEKGNVSISSIIDPVFSVSDSYVIEVKDIKKGYSLPLSYNGLGYNNLINIYMLIKLADVNEGKDFKILCLEEPEAHLHPAMQYKLFKFINNLNDKKELNQQVFVTTHSSNITAIAGLENTYIIQYDRSNKISDCYQQSLDEQLTDKNGTTFKSEAKRHLSKFLDVTRSDMLFADKVILVEGLAEKLLLPMFMEKVDYPYEDEHISIVEIGGKHFEYFVEIFNESSVKKKVLCITDKDFKWFNNESTFLLENYKDYEASHVKKLSNRFQIEEFNIVTQTSGGSTFEDELFIDNFYNEEVINIIFEMALSDTVKPYYRENGFIIREWIKNKESIDGRSKELIVKYLKLYEILENKDSKNQNFYVKLIFSKLFLHYIKNRKGDIALSILTHKELFDARGITKLKVPNYIKEGLEWLNQ